jgi:hypothetical protein
LAGKSDCVYYCSSSFIAHVCKEKYFVSHAILAVLGMKHREEEEEEEEK